jgi:type I restriction enzyme R subunit
MGIDFEEKAFFDILKEIANKKCFVFPDDKLILLSKDVKIIVEEIAKFTDWSSKLDLISELKVKLVLTLKKHGYPPDTKEEVFKEILEQAENFKNYV